MQVHNHITIHSYSKSCITAIEPYSKSYITTIEPPKVLKLVTLFLLVKTVNFLKKLRQIPLESVYQSASNHIKYTCTSVRKLGSLIGGEASLTCYMLIWLELIHQVQHFKRLRLKFVLKSCIGALVLSWFCDGSPFSFFLFSDRYQFSLLVLRQFPLFSSQIQFSHLVLSFSSLIVLTLKVLGRGSLDQLFWECNHVLLRIRLDSTRILQFSSMIATLLIL